jgi:hypothetical protein
MLGKLCRLEKRCGPRVRDPSSTASQPLFAVAAPDPVVV